MKKKMSKMEMRVAVAKDVIKQLKLGKYNTNDKTYCEFWRDRSEMNTYSLNEGANLQEALPQIPRCSVCAIGAAFLSLVKLDNKFNMPESCYYLHDNHIIDRLKGIFTSEQIANLEGIFETPSFYKDVTPGYFNMDRKQRLIALMKYIITHKGNISNLFKFLG